MSQEYKQSHSTMPDPAADIALPSHVAGSGTLDRLVDTAPAGVVTLSLARLLIAMSGHSSGRCRNS